MNEERPRTPMRVLRFTHSGVVSAWRSRERILIARGVDLELVTAEGWNEGGTKVTFAGGDDGFALSVRTMGQHPNLFLFDPRPLWRLLRSGPWDVIDIHEEPCSLVTAEILAVKALRRCRAPFVLYSAQNIFKRYPPPFRWIERWALTRAAGVSVCNEAAARILKLKGLRPPASVIALGVDTSHFSPEVRSGDIGDDRILRIGYVGRLESHKGVAVLLKAVADEPKWTVELIGEGPEAAALAGQARALGIDHRVRFGGFVDNDTLPSQYRAFDVVVVPSLPTPRWEEQFCRVAVESMASGIPVVVTTSGALPEVVGDAALLVPPGDPDALHHALTSLQNDQDLWYSLRERGLSRAARFSWEAIADDQLELYRSAMQFSAS
jgi:glycosyltransferase involved in cell wall biosynthesis